MWSVSCWASDLVAERWTDRLVGDVAAVRGDAGAGGRVLLRQPHGLRHRVRVDVARRDRAPLGGQLQDELAPHASAAARDDRQPTFEALHGSPFARSGG